MAETIVFRLSHRLGGEKAVMNAPMESLLVWLLMDKEERNTQRINDFMNMFYANPMTDAKSRQEYINGLFEEAAPKDAEQKVYVTNLDQLRMIKDLQETE